MRASPPRGEVSSLQEREEWGGKANRRVNPAARRTGRKEVRLMWSSSAILALNETRIFIATVNAILTPATNMSIYKTWTCRRVNIKKQLRHGEAILPMMLIGFNAPGLAHTIFIVFH